MRLRTFGGLWIDTPEPLAPLGARRMALLALVAAAGKRGVSRERVAGILWGEVGDEAARHNLSQNLYTLRRETGQDWITPAPKLCLNNGATSDIGEFLEALDAEEHERVADLYTGTFLQDFQLSGAPEFERWVEEERTTLRRTALRSIEILAAGGMNPAPTQAAVWWRRATEIDGLNGHYAAELIRALSASGDMVAALAHARAHEQLVRRELESDVDPSVRALIATMRHQAGKRLTFTPPEEDARSQGLEDSRSHGPGMARPLHAARPLLTRRLIVVGAVLAAVMAGLALFDSLRRPSTPFDSARPLAVGNIQSTDSAPPAVVLRDMLSTSLGGIAGLAVVDNSRLVELLPTNGDTANIADAARRAGAGEIFEGELIRVANGFRLSLRRVSLATGVVQRGYTVNAADPSHIIDSAAAAIARDLGLETPTRSVATTRTASPAAYALYERGLQALYRGYGVQAHGLMRAAFENDSTFAMAAYYGWFASLWTPAKRDTDLLEHARRLAPRTIDRERLLIAGTVSRWDSSVATAVAIAETLAVRYPQDPEAQMQLGVALENRGDFAQAITAYERAVALDSAANASAGPFCRLCSVLASEVKTYLWWDSLDAAVRTTQRSLALRPGERNALHDVVEPLLRLGRRAEAMRVLDHRESVAAPDGLARMLLRRDMIRWGDFEELDQQLIADLAGPSMDARGESRWLLLISLRNQGRLREAQALARDRIVPGTTRVADIEPELIHQALLAMETGDAAEAARRFRSAAEQVGEDKNLPFGVRARHVTWNLTLAGTAHATAGDTAAVRRLVDSVERTGVRSNFGRDQRLHHFLRGLLLQRGGKHDLALQEFRKATHSLSDGYTRINYEMARCLMQLGRAQEAIQVLRPALRGGVDGSNTYLTHTELHESMAQAFEAAGLRDSSRVHYRAVERAWRRADPQFATRYAVAKAKSG